MEMLFNQFYKLPFYNSDTIESKTDEISLHPFFLFNSLGPSDTYMRQ